MNGTRTGTDRLEVAIGSIILKIKKPVKKILEICSPSRIMAVIFSLWFIAGILIFSDYGISTDETTEHETSLVNYVYVMKRMMLGSKNETVRMTALETPELDSYRDRYYGVALQTLTVGIEHLFQFKLSTRTIFLIRHLFTFINYFIAGMFFYGILKKRFENDYVPLIGALLYILYPRFFGESFFNIKDILFFSWIVIASYFTLRWLEDGGVKLCLLSAAATAVSINTRILGLSILLLTCFFSILVCVVNKKSVGKTVLKTGTFIALTFLFLYVITPFLWEAPIKNFIETFNHFLHFPNWEGTHFYLGEMIPKEVPWHYIPVWMAVSVPVICLFLFVAGLIFFILNWAPKISAGSIAVKYNSAVEELPEEKQDPGIVRIDKGRLYDLFFMFFFFATLLGFVFLGIGMYEGWRHAYSIFCPFLYICVIGAAGFIGMKHRSLKTVVYCALLLCLGYQLVWIALNHPYQYAYFNIPGSYVAEKNFALDYWYVAQRDLINEVLAKNDDPIIKVFGLNPPQIEMLKETDKSRIFFSNASGADYYFIGSRVAYKNRKPPSGFDIMKSVGVGEVTISSVYEKMDPKVEIDYTARDHVAWIESNVYGDLHMLFDGDYGTFWMTNGEQAAGDYITIKFNQAVEYDYISLVLSELHHNYYPRELAIYTSADGANWKEISVTGNYLFENKPEPYNYLKLVNMKNHDIYGWVIFEIELGHSC